MAQLHITLMRPDRIRTGNFKEIYRNTLDLNESVSIPFELLIKAFKTLYPYNDLMVNFSLRP